MYKGSVNSNSIWLMLILVFSCPANLKAHCMAWQSGGPISGGQITSPEENGEVYLCGSKVTFSCTRPTDELEPDLKQHENDGG